MTVREQMFLYCMLVYERQSEEILNFVTPERSDRLKKELKKMERFPKEMRLTLIMKVIAYIVNKVRNPRLEMVHPTWIAQALSKEEAHVITSVLSQLPEEYQKRVAKLLGWPEQPVADPLTFSDEISDVMFQVFCKEFAPMRLPLSGPELSLDSLYLFREEDLMVLLKHIGVREIARAFALAGMDALTAVVNRFPEDLQKDFLDGVKSVKQDPERQKLAAKRLSTHDPSKMPLEEAALKIGLTKVGSVLNSRQDTARKIAQRLPMELGVQMLAVEIGSISVGDEEKEILETIQDLVAREKLDKKYVDNLFHTPMDSVQLKSTS